MASGLKCLVFYIPHLNQTTVEQLGIQVGVIGGHVLFVRQTVQV